MLHVGLKRSVRPEPVEGQIRKFPNEVQVCGSASCVNVTSVRCDYAVHFDRLSANGSYPVFDKLTANVSLCVTQRVGA